jgi:3-isopropylmalate/(R)-2-methylmalate dehydratase large subunit
MTIIEKIIAAHSGKSSVKAGDVVWMDVDYRSARDFGGPNVVEHLDAQAASVKLADPSRTFFTFDTNAPANTTGYADNQQKCRVFARTQGATLFDVDRGIGTHVAFEEGLVKPGMTAVGTDSHFNILGALGVFGQGMGDLDVAYIFKSGRTWFDVPETIRVELAGCPDRTATAKDIALFILKELGTEKALGKVVELSGDAIDALDFAGRITVASMATEAGAISFFMPPSEAVQDFYHQRGLNGFVQLSADTNTHYETKISLDIAGLKPLAAKPGSPNAGTPVNELKGVKVDSVFVGSCTNGRVEDLHAVAEILKGQRVAQGVMLKVVPATREVYMQILEDGTLARLMKAGAIVTQAGCGGCASGQVGMTGKGEVQVSTSNRNFRGKQGLGDTFLASPRTAAWTALRGELCNEDR